MKFERYWSALNADEKKTLAEALDTSVAYLSQIATRHRNAGAKILLKISGATGGKITAEDMRPEFNQRSSEKTEVA